MPGKVIVQGYGTLDFSRDDVPIETCKALHEADFEFLEITEEGKRELYGLGKLEIKNEKLKIEEPASSIEHPVSSNGQPEKRRTRIKKKDD